MENAKIAVEAPQPTEHREAYGTAKTENLSDSGLWRLLLPAVILGGSLALVAIPLIFLIPLLVKSFDPNNPANLQGHPLTWLWIVMIALILVLDAIIVRGLLKAFFSQDSNYRHS